MTEFAYSGVGINPHYGTPANSWQRSRRRIPGGSSSGAAVSVTDGMALAAIGSDTGGSPRIPAPLCGINGFKPTQRRIPLDGVFPLCTSQDSEDVMAPSVACCAAVDAVLAGEEAWEPVEAELRWVVVAVPRNYFLDGLEAPVARAFDRSLAAGAESSAIHRRLGADFPAYDPLVRESALRSAIIGAADYLEVVRMRAAIIEEFNGTHAAIDAIVCPVTPIVAPEVRALEKSTDEFRRVNALLLRNPSVVNSPDRCALSLPCHQKREAPVGLMVNGRTGGDRALLRIGVAMEKCLWKEKLQ